MKLTEKALAYHEKMLPGYHSTLRETDPEFAAILDNFSLDEVVNEPGQELPDKTRFLAILAALLGCQGLDNFKIMAEAALNFGVTPVELKEVVYQATAYLGIGRAAPFLGAVNALLQAKGVELPLEGQATTDRDTRLEQGNAIQIPLFGEGMRESWKTPSETAHINRWLAANCFGDYYTRTGLTLQQREMITFCFLFAQGGCEPQLISHIQANVKVGNDKKFLIAVVSQCMPYIGYPRTLNALRCVGEAAE